MDSGHVILSSVQPETVANRVLKGAIMPQDLSDPEIENEYTKA
jgi:regulator of extracellular matrix RemA (YlzA/DUF370 family)